MKKLVIVSMLSVLAMASVKSYAQNADSEKAKIKETKSELKAERKVLRKLEGSAVSEMSKSNFVSVFGNVPDAKWERTKCFDEVTYTSKGQKVTSYYDFYSNLVGTTSLKTFADLPKNSQNEIRKQYKDYTVKSVIFFDDNEAEESDMILWDLQFDDADNYFVELTKGNDHIIVRVDMDGFLHFFTRIK